MKCGKCLCRTCIHICDKCQGGSCLITSCDSYSQIRQMTFLPTKVKKKAISEYTWDDYGISKKVYRAIKKELEAGSYQTEAEEAALLTDKVIAPYILKSVRRHNGTYEDVEFDDKLGRIPVCRTYFYGYRRRFYYMLISVVNKRIVQNGA